MHKLKRNDNSEISTNVLKNVLNIRQRNAGPTSMLKSKNAAIARNEKINEVVEFASFGDVKSESICLLLLFSVFPIKFNFLTPLNFGICACLISQFSHFGAILF